MLALLGAEEAVAQQFETQPVTTATVGQQYTYEARVSNSGPGGSQITAPNGLPNWLTMEPRSNRATLRGVPTEVGVFRVLLRAENNACRGVLVLLCPTQTFDITVSEPGGTNQVPTLVPPGIVDQAGAEGLPFSLDVRPAFTDPDNDALTFTATGLPASLPLVNGVISGTPTADDARAAVLTVTVTAQDGRGGAVTDGFLITITQNAAPVVVAPVPDQLVAAGSSLSVNVAAAFDDPDDDALTFTVAGNPPGTSFASGVLSGSPPASAVGNSPYTVTATASDARGGSASDSFVIAVAPLASADVFLSGITAAPAPVLRNAAVEWTVTVGNAGPAATGAVDLAVEFAGNPVTFTANPCTLTVAADRQQLACTVGPIAGGATQSLKLTGSASQPGDVYATATVTGRSPADPNAANNRASLALNVAEKIVVDAAQPLTLHAAAIAAGDLNGDGFADLAVAAAADPAALLLDVENPAVLAAPLAQPGDRRRGLTSVPLTFGAGAAGADVALIDVDNDRDLDVLVANGPGNASAVFRNDGNSVLTPLATLAPPARDDRTLAAADLTGDGFADVVVGSAAGNWLYTSVSGTSFTESALPARNGAGAADVVLVDVVGSDRPDIVFVYAAGPVLRHENLGGSFGAAVTVDAGPASAAASADFNRDGRADLVLARSAPGANGLPANPVYLNNSAGGFVGVGTLGAAPTSMVLAGDVDGDGDGDVVAINTTGAHRLFLGDGDGNFRAHPQVIVSRGAMRGALGPIGQMRRADLVLAGPDRIDVFFNDGRGNLGLGDTGRPVIQLVGTPEVSIQVDGAYQDAGATVTDDVDTALTPTVANPVDPKVVGTYTVTYTAVDSSGNAAAPVTRTVRVGANSATGGGGGATGLPMLAVLLLCLAIRRAWAYQVHRTEILR